MAESLTEAWAAGRNSYIIDTLAFRGIIDVDAQLLRFQVAPLNSQVWADWLTVDSAGVVTLLAPIVGSVPWPSITGTPTTLAGYGITNGVSGSGTPDTLPKFGPSGQDVLDSTITDNGSVVTIAANVLVLAQLQAAIIESLSSIHSFGYIQATLHTGAISRAATLIERASAADGLPAGVGLGVVGTSVSGLEEHFLCFYATGNADPAGVVIGYLNDATGLFQVAVSIQNVASGFGTLNLMPAGGTTAHGGAVRLKGYTVATLPASPVVGDTAYVTNALLPTYGAVVAGGGAVVVPVFFNGVNWITA